MDDNVASSTTPFYTPLLDTCVGLESTVRATNRNSICLLEAVEIGRFEEVRGIPRNRSPRLKLISTFCQLAEGVNEAIPLLLKVSSPAAPPVALLRPTSQPLLLKGWKKAFNNVVEQRWILQFDRVAQFCKKRYVVE